MIITAILILTIIIFLRLAFLPLAIEFDFDNTMADTGDKHRRAWARYFEEEFGIRVIGDYSKYDNKTALQEGLRRRLTRKEVTEFGAQKESIWRRIVEEEGLEVKPGLMNFLKKYRFLFKYGIGTSAVLLNIQFALSKMDISKYITKFVTYESVEKAKPDPETYQKLAYMLRVPISSCVVLEDSLSGIESGIRSGAIVIAITGTLTKKELQSLPMERRPKLIIDSYDELTLNVLSKLMIQKRIEQVKKLVSSDYVFMNV